MLIPCLAGHVRTAANGARFGKKGNLYQGVKWEHRPKWTKYQERHMRLLRKMMGLQEVPRRTNVVR